MSMLMLHVQVQAARKWSWIMEVGMQDGHGHAAWTYICSMDIYVCSMDICLQHGHLSAASTGTQHVLGQAAWTWTLGMYWNMQHVLGHAACTGTCNMDMDT
jgi:hypothetical protein